MMRPLAPAIYAGASPAFKALRDDSVADELANLDLAA
jgi:hypothetical protein